MAVSAPIGFVAPNEQQCYPALPVTDPAPTVVNVQTQQAPAPQIIVVGGCPSCRVKKFICFYIHC